MNEKATPQAEVAAFQQKIDRLREEIGRVIVGNRDVIDGVLTCMLAGSHALLEGVPGLGKTELVKTLGRVLKRPSMFYVPAFMLRLAKGEFAQVITASIRARPLRTLALGYEFKYPHLRDALLEIEGAKAG